ncbi:MAG: hypothetical protein IJS41_07525 [Clostridia bacterium]|nr:hypothetical protein [Clostridia bacterium]
MLKLMKYEFRKTWFTKLILLGVTAVAEILFLFGLYLENENTLGTSVFLLTILAIGGVLVIGLQSVITLHQDMNTRQSYMLFMTPNSSYVILGAKVLEFGLSVAVTGAFFFALGTLDITLLFAKSGELNQLWNMIQDFLSRITLANGTSILNLNTQTMAIVTFNMLCAWINMVTTAYLAVTVSAALLNGKRFNGLLSFILFLAISWASGWLEQIATQQIPSVETSMLVQGGIALLTAAVMYVATAQIMEKKLSV